MKRTLSVSLSGSSMGFWNFTAGRLHNSSIERNFTFVLLTGLKFCYPGSGAFCLVDLQQVFLVQHDQYPAWTPVINQLL